LLSRVGIENERMARSLSSNAECRSICGIVRS
jgi:hypothetical protein